MEDYLNVTMDHFRKMCLDDPVMQALYREEISWADIPEDDSPLDLRGWSEYREEKYRSAAAVRLQFESSSNGAPAPVTQREVLSCWRQPPRVITSPSSSLKSVSSPKKVYAVSEEDLHKRTLLLPAITEDITNEMIREVFEPYGGIQCIHRSKKGFVLLQFRTMESAQKAYLAHCESLVLNGKKKTIRFN